MTSFRGRVGPFKGIGGPNDDASDNLLVMAESVYDHKNPFLLLAWELCAHNSSRFSPNGATTSWVHVLCCNLLGFSTSTLDAFLAFEVHVDVVTVGILCARLSSSLVPIDQGLQPMREEEIDVDVVSFYELEVIENYESCWNGNVVIDLDFGGAAWNHVCSHAVFDASLSIQPCSVRLSMVVEIDLYVSLASLDCLCSHCGFYFCGTIAFAGMSVIDWVKVEFADMTLMSYALARQHEPAGVSLMLFVCTIGDASAGLIDVSYLFDMEAFFRALVLKTYLPVSASWYAMLGGGIHDRFVLAAMAGWLAFLSCYILANLSQPFSRCDEGGDPRKKVGVSSGMCDMYM
ncbi:hypothetical protein Tco_1561933 [Tanacetum coccineum]